MGKKKVFLIARDAAPSGCFKLLSPVLYGLGFDTIVVIGEGKPITESIDYVELVASEASVVVLGMSSSAELAQFEIAAGEAAKKAGVPYGFYGDVPFCFMRARKGAWFENLAHDASFYFGLNQEEINAAREVFPKAELVVTGNPLREEMAFPRFSREEVRAKLAIKPEEMLVLAPGGKSASGNMVSWVVIMEALSLLSTHDRRKSFQLILSTHPGDRTPYAIDASTQKEMRLYGDLIDFSPIPARVVSKDLFTTSDMVSGADIIVEFGSSIGIEGAYQNVPVISLGFEVFFQRLEKVSGNRMLEAVQNGLSELVVADVNKLASTINRLLSFSGFAPMRVHQEELCPKPTERGAALRKISDSVSRYIL